MHSYRCGDEVVIIIVPVTKGTAVLCAKCGTPLYHSTNEDAKTFVLLGGYIPVGFGVDMEYDPNTGIHNSAVFPTIEEAVKFVEDIRDGKVTDIEITDFVSSVPKEVIFSKN